MSTEGYVDVDYKEVDGTEGTATETKQIEKKESIKDKAIAFGKKNWKKALGITLIGAAAYFGVKKMRDGANSIPDSLKDDLVPDPTIAATDPVNVQDELDSIVSDIKDKAEN